MPQTTRTRVPAWLLGSGVIAVAMGVMNLGSYGFTILAARLLGPSEYGALAAVMGLLLVVNVVSLGLQATGARRVSVSPEERGNIESDVLSTTYRSAAVLGLVCLAAAPLVTALLRLDNLMTAVLMAVTAVPLTVMGGQAGILQGERRWLPLAGVYLLVGVGRLAFGVLALLVQPSATSAMVGVAVGACTPAVLGWAALRSRATAGSGGPPLTRSRRAGWAKGGVLREAANNSHALLAFFALSNADVVVARSVLDEREAGLYAGGLILAKAVLFLPQFVLVIAFPSMSEANASRNTHLKGLGLLLAIGALATGGAWLLSGLAVAFVGGGAYSELQPVIWAFAAVGTLLVMLQLMIYNIVALQKQREVFAVWAALLVLVSLAPLVGSMEFLLACVLTVDACLLVLLVALSLRRPAKAQTAA
ncbi:MAG: lipopolysaccharide biosynthesis protein [Nocardioidaceae bacterium]